MTSVLNKRNNIWMEDNNIIMDSLARLDVLCTSGYAVALHIRFTTPRFLFQTYNKDWMEIYSEKGLVLQDPTVLWGFSNTGVARWQDLEELDDNGILPMAKTFGLNYGFTFAIDQNASKSITSFARHDRDFTDAEVEEITTIAQEMHDYTAKIDDLSADEMKKLKKFSIEFTRGAD